MPTKRPTLSDRLKPTAEPRGADAYFGSGSGSARRAAPRSRQPATDSGKPEAVSPDESTPSIGELMVQPGRRKGPKWDETNQRASFYLPVDLLQQLAGVAGPALSKSQIVTAALQHYLRGATGRKQ